MRDGAASYDAYSVAFKKLAARDATVTDAERAAAATTAADVRAVATAVAAADERRAADLRD